MSRKFFLSFSCALVSLLFLFTTLAFAGDNANNTGWGNFNKAVPEQRVHGAYMKDTNSCASCHMTHTAAGEKLLFENGIYETCTACHDGTGIAYLNVMDTSDNVRAKMATSSDKNTYDVTKLYYGGAGTFNLKLGKNGSKHNLHGLANSAAPGGNRGGSNSEVGLFDKDGNYVNESTWAAEFTCASCHAPHNSWSSRLLHYNPNNVSLVTPDKGGYYIEGASLVRLSDAAADDLYNKAVDEDAPKPKLDILKAWKDAIGDIYVAYNDREYITKPWLYGYEYSGDPPNRKKVYWTYIYDSEIDRDNLTDKAVKQRNDKFEVMTGSGYAKKIDSNYNPRPLWIDVAPALVVKFTEYEAAYPTADPDDMDDSRNDLVKGIANYGEPLAISKYCGACHTDYNQTRDVTTVQANGGDPDEDGKNVGRKRGTFSEAFRHNINIDELKAYMVGSTAGRGDNATTMECLTCHYAHGADQNIQLEADNTFAQSPDVNHSSAIKRYVNMAVCWRCHTDTQSVSLVNNDFYWNDLEGGYKTIYPTLFYNKVTTQSQLEDALEDTSIKTITLEGNFSGFTVSRSGVTIIGEDATVKGSIRINTDNVSFSGLDVQVTGPGDDKAGFYVTGSGISFRNCTISGTNPSGEHPTNGIMLTPHKGQMALFAEDVKFVNLYRGIYLNGTPGENNRNLIATGNAFEGVWYGIGGTEGSTIKVEDNSFKNGKEGIGLGEGVTVRGTTAAKAINYLKVHNSFSGYETEKEVFDHRN